MAVPFHCWPHQHNPSALMMQVPVPQQRSSWFMGRPEYSYEKMALAPVAACEVQILLESGPPVWLWAFSQDCLAKLLITEALRKAQISECLHALLDERKSDNQFELHYFET